MHGPGGQLRPSGSLDVPQLPQPSLILSGTYGFRVVSEPQSLPRTPVR